MIIVAFDLDGTIADTIPMCIEAFCESISPYIGHDLTEKEVVQTFGLNEIGMVKAVVKNDWENALCDFYEKYKILHDKVDTPFPLIYELLLWLKEHKIFLALITGKGEKCCDISLKKLKLENIFDEVLYGSEKKQNKVENIKLLIKKYAIPKSSFYYVGDTKQDVTACREAGVTCLSAVWQESSYVDIVEKENAGLVFYSVSELWDYLSDLV